MSGPERDLACEECGTPGGVGHWVSHRWLCQRCVLLAQMESERLLPVSPARGVALPPSERVVEFRRLIGLLAVLIEDDFLRGDAAAQIARRANKAARLASKEAA